MPIKKRAPTGWQNSTLHRSRRSVTLLKKRLWHRCFPVNFTKFLRTPFLQNTSGRLILPSHNNAQIRIWRRSEGEVIPRILNQTCCSVSLIILKNTLIEIKYLKLQTKSFHRCSIKRLKKFTGRKFTKTVTECLLNKILS